MQKKRMALALCAVVSVSFCLCGATGCSPLQRQDVSGMRVNMLSNTLAVALLGDSVTNWNRISVDPLRSYGVDYGEMTPKWATYVATTDAAITNDRYVFGLFEQEIAGIDERALNKPDAAKFRTLQNVVKTYTEYYGSQYVKDFELFATDSINSHGGWVESFASSYDNFIFREEVDIVNLLALTDSVGAAFASYLDFAADRVESGYPLYDYTITEMQEYLNDIYALGSDFYLYELIDKKLDAAEFLTSAEKASYKQRFEKSLTDNFMAGVHTLADGLDEYKGNVIDFDKSYLAAYGEKGKAYYEWQFKRSAGLWDVDLDQVYNSVVVESVSASYKLKGIKDRIAALQSGGDIERDYQAYSAGTKSPLGLDNKQAMLDYLKTAARSIVPDLTDEPQIIFKEMDSTVAGRTNAIAYYALSPLDERNSAEEITFNPNIPQNEYLDTLSTMAHEGYPGHLYSYVYSKERGADLLQSVFSCSAFIEGWAQYVAYTVVDDIVKNTQDEALRLFAEKYNVEQYVGYLNMLLLDMDINYYGKSVTELAEMYQITPEKALELLKNIMEDPAAYVPYGYGMYRLVNFHKTAKESLGNKYSRTALNSELLSEGYGPTLARAKQLTQEYVAKASA